MTLQREVESLLFVAAKPLSLRQLAKLTGKPVPEVAEAVDALRQLYNRDERGIHLQHMGEQVQLVTSPLNAKLVTDYIQEELRGDLSDPAIETLTIVAYRGPIAKTELDQIRGVNCSLILRHLMIKGLVESLEDKAALTTRYQVSLDFLRFMGLRSVTELPEYETLRTDENLQMLLQQGEAPAVDAPPTPAEADSAAKTGVE